MDLCMSFCLHSFHFSSHYYHHSLGTFQGVLISIFEVLLIHHNINQNSHIYMLLCIMFYHSIQSKQNKQTNEQKFPMVSLRSSLITASKASWAGLSFWPHLLSLFFHFPIIKPPLRHSFSQVKNISSSKDPK